MMDRVIAVLAGVICGIGQFFILWRMLKPLTKGQSPRTAMGMILKLPLPIALLVGCAFVDVDLLPFTGAAFCVGLMAASVINHYAKKKED